MKGLLLAGALLLLGGCGDSSTDATGRPAAAGSQPSEAEPQPTTDPTTTTTSTSVTAQPVRSERGVLHAYFLFSDSSDDVVEPVAVTFRVDGEVVGEPAELSAEDGDVDRTMDVSYGSHEIAASWQEYSETMVIEVDAEMEWVGIKWAGRDIGFVIEQYKEAPFWG